MRIMFPSRSARLNFTVLCVGVLAILMTSLFLYDMYLQNRVTGLPRRVVIRNAMKAAQLSQHLDPVVLKKNIIWLNGRGISVKWMPQPFPYTRVINRFNRKSLVKRFRKHVHRFKYNIALSDGNWLLIQSNSHSKPWLLSGFRLVSLLVLISIFLLCYWAIKRTAMPVDKLVYAAERFGRDVQAPPLAVQGTKEMRGLIQAFNSMQLQIRRLVMDRTQMLAAISHDLRTPITRLQLRVEYLEGTGQYHKACQDLSEMEEMIASILAFAKNYASSERTERVDVVSLLDSICDEQQDTGANVTFSSKATRLVCYARMISLKRAFNNIINNAVKYGLSAEVTLAAEGKQVLIYIQDRGPGIPENEFDKIFEPFYRVDQSRSPQKSGSGLGLAVTRDIIRSHGGEITVRNTEDPSGLLLKVTLPLA